MTENQLDKPTLRTQLHDARWRGFLAGAMIATSMQAALPLWLTVFLAVGGLLVVGIEEIP